MATMKYFGDKIDEIFYGNATKVVRERTFEEAWKMFPRAGKYGDDMEQAVDYIVDELMKQVPRNYSKNAREKMREGFRIRTQEHLRCYRE